MWLGRNPDEEAFSNFAKHFDSFEADSRLFAILESAESLNHRSNQQFADILGKRLGGANHADEITSEAQAALNCGQQRSVVLLRALDSAAFRNAIPDQAFVRHLLHDMIRDTTTNTAQQLLLRLRQGDPRSKLWREALNSDQFYLAELQFRQVDRKDAPEIWRRHFFTE